MDSSDSYGRAQKTTQATSIAAPKATFPPGVSRAHQYKINETSKKLPKNMSASACWVYRVIRVWASSLGCFLQELQPVTSTHAGTCSCSWPSCVPSLRTGSCLFLVWLWGQLTDTCWVTWPDTVRAVEGDSEWAGRELTPTEVVFSGKFPCLSYGLLITQA